MLRSTFVFRLLPRRLSVSSTKFNIHFQGKLDEEIKKAVGGGLDKPSLIYDHLVKINILTDDSFQREIVKQLDSLNSRLKGYHPTQQSTVEAASKSISQKFSSFFSREPVKKELHLKPALVPGAYLYGNVGTGKTMLMDLFYSTTPVTRKRRVHFHAFMLGIHEKTHQLRLNQNLDAGQLWSIIADELMGSVSLLCFDEFQVTDIADAMNMKQLFSALFERGIIVIATSNRHPDNLYEHGLQRQNFLPFIPMLKSQVKIINLDSGMDYRKSEVFDFNHPSWLIKGDEKIEFHVNRIHDRFGRGEKEIKDKKLNVLGHKLRIPSSIGAVGHFTFDDLCQEGLGVPLGAQDYLALAEKYAAIIITDVPRIDLYVMNSALKRFIILVDNFYDNKIGLLLIFDTHLDELYYDSHTSERELTITERQFMDDHEVHGVAAGVKIATLSGSEEAFAIDRKISRLAEMSSETYWNEVRGVFEEKEKRKNKN